MARALTAARAMVASANRTAYREAMAVLANSHMARGEHLWLFESRDSPGTFLEFREGRPDADADPADARLEARLGELADYDASRHQCWDEVSLLADRREANGATTNHDD